MKSEVKYHKIFNALSEINSNLGTNLNLSDILKIEDNSDILKAEENFFGEEIGDTFFFYKEGDYFKVFNKQNVNNQIQSELKKIYMSGDVFLNGVKISSTEDFNSKSKAILDFIEGKFSYILPNFYIMKDWFKFFNTDSYEKNKIGSLFSEMAQHTSEANNMLPGREIPITDLYNEGIFSYEEITLLKEILKDYSGNETIKRGISIYNSDVPNHFPISYGFPNYYLLKTFKPPEFDEMDAVILESDKGVESYLIKESFNFLPFSKEKIKVLKILGLKTLREICPKLMSESSYMLNLKKIENEV